MTRATTLFGSLLLALGTVLLGSCSSQSPLAETESTAPSAGDDEGNGAPRPEQALLEDLAIANRILARELDILDIQGHTSVRSQANPSHWYMPKFVSPGGAVAGDMIEYDLDSKEVHGPRTDNARETYLHGEIYRARPDIMAIVHSHTPEFVAFGMSSVPLYNGDMPLPVWDIRPFNRGRNGIVSTTALGKAMAEKLGQAEAVLLWGHGIAFGAASLADAIAGVDELRDSAQMQQAAITMGGSWTPQPRRATVEGAAARTWDFHKKAVLSATDGRVPASPEPAPERPSDPDQASAHDVVLANRILADELRILDTLGHVSLRNARNPNSYFVAPRVAPGGVASGDVIQRDITTSEPDTIGLSIHDEIYKARPDVNAVLYARTPEVAAFTTGAATLRPVVNGGAFIGNGFPVFTMPTLDGRGIAEALGKSRGVLLGGRGFVLTSASIYNLVDQAYALRHNALIQRQAMGLRGRVSYLNERPPDPAPATPQPQQPGPTGPAEGRAWIYWSQNVSLE
jgi:HCOMODA/2-hydroxy-3-carboxy-muconic semialdehyde decarboxylase